MTTLRELQWQKRYDKDIRPFRTSLRWLIDWDKRVINLKCDVCGFEGTVSVDHNCNPTQCVTTEEADGLCDYCDEFAWSDGWITENIEGKNNVILCAKCSKTIDEAIQECQCEVEDGLMAYITDLLACAARLGNAIGVKVTTNVDKSKMVKGAMKIPSGPAAVELFNKAKEAYEDV